MFRSHDKDMSGFISKDDVLCMLLGADKVRRFPLPVPFDSGCTFGFSARPQGPSVQDPSEVSDQHNQGG
ncbi:hypothetical protein Y032_0401g797 [Ancylostoma ceylanicum]|uniref:EF-hand domain-containing protein n=1 Tax=Ancylostoma ceylanicum TaxID=53326 RepID=A0A016X349_9BILA|nr:hypothetical protein Y032_0401g797 [Ancylostoma ceylanicum]